MSTTGPNSMRSKSTRRGAGLSTDVMLGIAGCTLAAASATFGIAMSMNGPVSSFGKSGNFTVFAQLAPRGPVDGAASDVERAVAADMAKDRELDLTSTASIPRRAPPTSERTVASSVTLQDASAEAATIRLDGRSIVVRVGDTIPGVGEVLAIVPGATPMLRTTGGVIAAATLSR